MNTENAVDATAILDEIYEFPKIREQCLKESRPCPWVRCKWHLLREIPQHYWKKTDEELIDIMQKMPYTCVLDMAEHGDSHDLQTIADCLFISRERARQLIDGACHGKVGGAIPRIRRLWKNIQLLKPFMEAEVHAWF